MKNHTEKPIPTRAYHASPRLTHAFKRQMEKDVKYFWVNEDLVNYIMRTLEKLPAKDKLPALYYFKKLAIQVIRKPDNDWYKANRDEVDDFISAIAEEQRHFEPVKWIDAEIRFLTSMEQIRLDKSKTQADLLQDVNASAFDGLWTEQMIMEKLDLSKSSLGRRMADGLPSHKVGKFNYFDPKEIVDWIKSQPATSEA